MTDHSCTIEEYTAITAGLTDYVTDNVQEENGFRIRLSDNINTAEVSRMTDAEGNPVHGQLVLRMSANDHDVEKWGDSAEEINRAIRTNFGVTQNE